MPFIQIGSAAASVAAGAGGENVLIFPHGAMLSREERVAREIAALRRAMVELVIICGVTGASRISILLLEEITKTNRPHVVASKSLSEKIAKLSQTFIEDAVS